MADGAVSLAIENVGNFLVGEAKLLSGVREQVEEMQTELKWMQCFLRDADRRQGESHTVRNWVSQIREAAYDVEDVIERFALKSALRRREGVVNRIKRYAFYINHLVELHQVGSKIEAIKTRLTKLRTSLQTYGIKEMRVGGEGTASSRWRKRQDYAHVVDHNVVGLDHKIAEIVDHLLDVGQEDHHSVGARRSESVICISGMGGLGKTTLAKQVYGDGRVKGHFEGFAWVYISQEFKERDIWESILSQLSGKQQKEMTNDELTAQLCKIQKEKRCLVVIDDIWRSGDWVKLSVAFPYMEDDNKSKILLTTRNKEAALHGVHHTGLDILDDNNSLKLLINTIQFLGGLHHPIKNDSTLKQCASDMVKQCKGLPLAITVLGGILATKHELQEWEKIGDNIRLLLNRGNAQEDIGVSSVLESSYYDLPYNLKSCFLYLSHYPEDHEIRSTQLIQRWMGEGFVVSQPECVGETMEDIGEQYLNELVSRCMIQVGKRSYTGRVKTCRMHDLMRDLCISKAKEENFMHFISNDETTHHDLDKTSNIRRMCIFQRDTDLSVSPQLRSLLCLQRSDNIASVKNLKLCRVLVLKHENRYRKIQKLLHLRYLSLTGGYSGDPTWGSSMDKLRCLQTLDLRGCDYLKLSNSIWMMEQLRHLYLPEFGCECESGKQQVCNFRNLQTLTNFPPFKFDLQQNLVKFTNVRKLVLLRGMHKEVCEVIRSKKLVFTRLHSCVSMDLFYESLIDLDLEAITTSCPNLYKLCVKGQIKTPPAAASTCLWPSNLTKLVLIGSGLDAIYVEQLGKLQSLKILFMQFHAFIGKEMIFHENDFPQLQHLVFAYLLHLEAWRVHEGALPVLSRLEIVSCWKLKSVPDGLQYLKQLKELQVEDMSNDFKKRLESGGDDWHKVSHVSSISFIRCDESEPEIETENDIEVEVEQEAEH